MCLFVFLCFSLSLSVCIDACMDEHEVCKYNTIARTHASARAHTHTLSLSFSLFLSLSLSLTHTHTLTHSLTHSHSLKVTVPHMIVTEVSRVRQRAAETAGLVGLGAGAECLAVAGGLGLGAIEADGGREMIMSRVGALAE